MANSINDGSDYRSMFSTLGVLTLGLRAGRGGVSPPGADAPICISSMVSSSGWSGWPFWPTAGREGIDMRG